VARVHRVIAPSQADERVRILDAFIEVVAERGYKQATLDEVLDRAEVDQPAFHRHFADMEGCFLVAWDYISADYLPAALTAFESEDVWLDQMRAIGGAIVEYLRAHPDHGRFLFVEGANAGVRAHVLLERNVGAFVELIDLGRRELDDPESLSRATAEGIAGAVNEKVSLALIRGADEEMAQLVPQLMFMVAQPYLGLDVALEELNRPVRSSAD
jgi:AcrR family transcriptional regulator